MPLQAPKKNVRRARRSPVPCLPQPHTHSQEAHTPCVSTGWYTNGSIDWYTNGMHACNSVRRTLCFVLPAVLRHVLRQHLVPRRLPQPHTHVRKKHRHYASAPVGTQKAAPIVVHKRHAHACMHACMHAIACAPYLVLFAVRGLALRERGKLLRCCRSIGTPLPRCCQSIGEVFPAAPTPVLRPPEILRKLIT
jgi:hypothetical protein